MSNQPFTVATFKERKAAKVPVTMLTAYDYSMAQLVEEAGIDTILVWATSCSATARLCRSPWTT